jgi:hypothetical protein
LTADAEKARAEIAEANARAAEAQLALEQFKAPRQITDAQKDLIVEHLKPFHDVSVGVFLIHAPSVDTPPLAERLLSVLEAAQWKATGVFNLMGGPIGNGIAIVTRENPAPSDTAAATALVGELNSIGILAVSEKGVTDSPVSVLGAFVGPDAPQTPANIWVVVGSKP